MFVLQLFSSSVICKMARTFQSRGFICKTVSKLGLQRCIDFVRGVPGSRWAWALHRPSPPKVEHFHFVGLFEDRVYWKAVADDVERLDRCSSTDSCKRPRKAVRYLLHLDSPEKHAVDKSDFHSDGMWGPDELDDWLSVSSSASNLVSSVLSLYESGLSPIAAFDRLCSIGYEPHQISSSLLAYTRLHEFYFKFVPSIKRTSVIQKNRAAKVSQGGEKPCVQVINGEQLEPLKASELFTVSNLVSEGGFTVQRDTKREIHSSSNSGVKGSNSCASPCSTFTNGTTQPKNTNTK